MSSTPRLSLPLVQPGQAQKHVTVNESLVLIDGLIQLRLASVATETPPEPVTDGVCHGVPDAATGAWAGQGGTVAIGTGGGWVFAVPQAGWRAWIVDEGREGRFDGAGWAAPALSSSASGAAARLLTMEAEHTVLAGDAQDTVLSIPAKGMVFAASARVIEPIGGTASTWRLGTAGADDRFGSGLGLEAGSYSDGILATPLTYYAAEPLRIAPDSGAFTSGRIRLALHVLTFDLPGV